MDVGEWLRKLGLGRYERVFVENAIDSDVLPELTEGDLEKLGIPLGDRKRLIKAIRAMAAGSPSAFITRAVGWEVQSGQSRAAAAERRHVTVMICDLVGSTALSTRLDPEDMRTVMDAYHSACESRFEAVHAAGLTDFIGREDELDFLLERQRLAWKGEGQIVLISGEPGIGKSGRAFWNFIDDEYLAWDLEVGDPADGKLTYVFRRRDTVGAQHDRRGDVLPQRGMGDGKGYGLCHRWML
jgi:hypothetical protein